MMIARIWKGTVRKEDGNAYADYMRDTGVSGYTKTPGNRGVWMLRRDVDELTEFMMFTLWETLDAVKAFAGPATKPQSSIRRIRGFSLNGTSLRLITTSRQRPVLRRPSSGWSGD
jgi:heme-degrading monooxygenase HmoA